MSITDPSGQPDPWKRQQLMTPLEMSQAIVHLKGMLTWASSCWW
jgi:hypothetical protein